MSDANIIFYFFSTTAQVWAALVAFGGIGIRELIRKTLDSRDISFLEVNENLRPIKLTLHDKSIIFPNDSLLDLDLYSKKYLENRNSIVELRKSLEGQVFNSPFQVNQDSKPGRELITSHKALVMIGKIIFHSDKIISNKVFLDKMKNSFNFLLIGGLVLCVLPTILIIFKDYMATKVEIFYCFVGLISAASVILVVKMFLGFQQEK